MKLQLCLQLFITQAIKKTIQKKRVVRKIKLEGLLNGYVTPIILERALFDWTIEKSF